MHTENQPGKGACAKPLVPLTGNLQKHRPFGWHLLGAESSSSLTTTPTISGLLDGRATTCTSSALSEWRR